MGPNSPRLALVDWMMPKLDGPGLCREIRSQHIDGDYRYILVLTSKQSSDDIVAGLEAGADDYITKPSHPAELKARLDTGRRILSLEQKLVQAREEMRYQATRDGLTSLWNRASILGVLTGQMDRAIRRRKSVSALLCDIDRFKTINDTHCHLVGDRVIQEVARRLSHSVRTYDAVGRYGGEEFLVVLEDCDRCDLYARREDIRLAISTSPVRTGNVDLPVSISIGAVSCSPFLSRSPIELILASADDALYRAKELGRDRVVLGDPIDFESRRSVEYNSMQNRALASEPSYSWDGLTG
jgi:two-component system cell cycle response regulator